MAKNKITRQKRILVPVGVGLLAAALLSSIYFVNVFWAESFEHAMEFFWQDRSNVVPNILGFGIQAALYSILKLQLHLPVINIGQVGSTIITHTTDASVGASGTTCTVAWDRPQGGHHVEGKLTFSKTIDNKNIFDGAHSIKRKISEVDAPLRIFSWQINE